MAFTHLQVEAAVLAMMEGQTPENVEAAAAIPAATLKKWAKKYCVQEWAECEKLGRLLRSGLFHVTSRECLGSIVESGEIAPFTSGQFKDWKFTDPTIAEELKSVAVYDFEAVSPPIAASRIMSLASQINHHKPAVLLQLDPAALSQPLVRWTAQLQKEHPYRESLAHVEAWHAGSIPWTAVTACWTWAKQGQLLGQAGIPRTRWRSCKILQLCSEIPKA